MTTPAVIAEFDQATKRISAYHIAKGAKPIGRVVFILPGESGLRLRCFAQVWGGPMVRAHVGGGGYDKHSASARLAFAKLAKIDGSSSVADVAGTDRAYIAADAVEHIVAFAKVRDDGVAWSRQLEDAGYTVQHVTN